MILTDELKLELEEICDDNGLTIDYDFNYPIRITIKDRMQVNMFDGVPMESYLEFKFSIDQIDLNFAGDFRLDDKLFSKISGKVKKLHYIYLQEWYSQKANRFKNCIKSMWKIASGDYVAIVKSHYEG
jgi:hypothetical protein